MNYIGWIQNRKEDDELQPKLRWYISEKACKPDKAKQSLVFIMIGRCLHTHIKSLSRKSTFGV